MSDSRKPENNMRMITGALLILSSAISIAPIAWLDLQDFCSFPVGWLSVILAGITALLGLVYLFLGSLNVNVDARWYQFTIKSLLLLAIFFAVFFSGRALGIVERKETPFVTSPIPVIGLLAPSDLIW